MARRRVNTKFLTILTCVVLGLAVLGVLVKMFLIRESPEKYVAAGNQLMGDKKFDEAAKNFAHAVALDQKNPALWVSYGDALNEMSPQDTEYMNRARQAWESALAVDPTNKPALDRMMSFWSDWANMDSSQPLIFERLESTAKRLLEADPSNSAAEVAMITSVIRPWLGGVEKREQEILDSVSKLVKLMDEEKHKENPDIPMFAGQAKLRLAERKRQQGRPDEEEKLVKEAQAIVERATQRTPSAAMFFSGAQVYQAQELVGLMLPEAERTGVRDPKVWRQKKREMYAKAREVVELNDPLYVHIHINSARAIADDREASEKILRDLMQKMPDDQMVRLALAEQLASHKEKRDDALKILEMPFAAGGLRGPKAVLSKELQVRTLVMLTNLRIEEFGAADEEQRKKLIEPIRDGLAKVEAKDGVGPRSLRLKGKLLRLQGETVEAIQTLERARQMAEQRGSLELVADRLDRWEVIDLLARAYLETNQIGQAKMLLRGLVDRFPAYEPARRLLAQILIKDGSYDEAKQHVEYFRSKDPNDPEVQKWAIQLMDPKAIVRSTEKEAERKQLREAYAKLPEQTKGEMLDKVNAAMVIEYQDDAMRLLNKAQQQFPGDFDVAQTAVRVHRHTGDV